MKSKVLVAEDNGDMAKMCRIALELKGHTVVITRDGEACVRTYRDAVNKLDKEPSRHEPFDIVILDCRMPRMDGVEAAKEIFAMNKRQRLAFAAAHIGKSKDSVSERYRVEILQKPFEPKELIKLVENG
ncbi:response regulator [Nitrososphaera sp.]|uniref:response regulator n=1 Tax=Nitrososphaera sp. TaxID=1971748 RepID=UPI002EDAC27C